MTDIDPVGRRALSFTVSGDWAHFRRIDTTTVKHTYRVIPRTTLSGLVAAILGEPRDSYYDAFAPENAAIAVGVNEPVSTTTIPQLQLTTSADDGVYRRGENQASGNDLERGFLSIESTLGNVDDAGPRQQNVYEYVNSPTYTVTLTFRDEERFDRLQSYLADGRTTYTPYLGTSECLAAISYDGTHTIRETTADAVDSVAPVDRADATGDVTLERSPRHMEADDYGRKPTGFLSLAYNADGEQTPLSEPGTVYTVGDRTVLFT